MATLTNSAERRAAAPIGTTLIIAMDDQRREIELFEVFGEISLGECLDAVKGIFVATLHALQPEGIV